MTADNPRKRICARCGERWQVSKNVSGPKRYYCPECETIRKYHEERKQVNVRTVPCRA